MGEMVLVSPGMMVADVVEIMKFKRDQVWIKCLGVTSVEMVMYILISIPFPKIRRNVELRGK